MEGLRCVFSMKASRRTSHGVKRMPITSRRARTQDSPSRRDSRIGPRPRTTGTGSARAAGPAGQLHPALDRVGVAIARVSRRVFLRRNMAGEVQEAKAGLLVGRRGVRWTDGQSRNVSGDRYGETNGCGLGRELLKMEGECLPVGYCVQRNMTVEDDSESDVYVKKVVNTAPCGQ